MLSRPLRAGDDLRHAVRRRPPRRPPEPPARSVEPEVRAELVNRLAATGLPRIEAASFVNPSRVPQMAGAEEVVDAIVRRPGVVYAGLALNERGYDRLLATGLDEVHFAFAASETFNQRNQGAAVADSVAAATRIVARARADGVRSTVTISTAFGCPFEGRVAPDRVLELAAELATASPDEIVLADTIGVAVPREVSRLVAAVVPLGVAVGVHLHNTRNTGYANALAAVGAGATLLDSSLGGIGGCPFAPRATGNIATEDLVYLLHGEGIETGVDLEALIAVAAWLEGVLGHGARGPGLPRRPVALVGRLTGLGGLRRGICLARTGTLAARASGTRPERKLRAAQRVLRPACARARVEGQGRGRRAPRPAAAIGRARRSCGRT